MTFDRRTPVKLEVQKSFTEPVFFGFDYIPELKEAMKGDYVFVDHAYFGRGYKAGNFRVIRNNVHKTTLGRTDKPKTFFLGDYKEAKRRGHILVFPPSPTMVETFGAQHWVAQTVEEIRKHTGRPIVIKHKHSEQPLKWFLKDAHACIGFGTVAVVEAALNGVPVVAGPRCPATPIACPMEKIEDPYFAGDREAWFNSLTWAQFSREEIANGLMKEVLNGP